MSMPALLTLLRGGLLAILLSVPAAGDGVPKFNIDLDVAPEERWIEVIDYFRERGIIKALLDQAETAGPAEEVKEAWFQAVRPQVDEDTIREIHGWMRYGDEPRISEKSAILSNLVYEMNYPTFCSGLLAALPNGTVIHARNMDYVNKLNVSGKILGWPELTLHVTTFRGGKPFYTSVYWPMNIGLHSATRFDGWSFEQNTRRFQRDAEENLAACQHGGLAHSIFARRTMETVPDFETALQRFQEASWCASHYFLLSGPKPYQGVVLSVDRMGVEDPLTPKERWLSEKRGRWYLLQTNDDSNKLFPVDDPRRPLEEFKLSHSLQDDVSVDFVTREMRTAPLSNPFTVYTFVTVVATGYSALYLPNKGEAAEEWAKWLGPAGKKLFPELVVPVDDSLLQLAGAAADGADAEDYGIEGGTSETRKRARAFSEAVEEVAEVLSKRAAPVSLLEGTSFPLMRRGGVWLP